MDDYPDHDAFARHLGDHFDLHVVEGNPMVVELVEAKELPRQGRADVPDVRQQPFALVFTLPGDVALPQGTYPLEHADLGRMDVFLVPVGRNEKGLMLEAVFA